MVALPAIAPDATAQTAREVLGQAGRLLGFGASFLVSILNPELLVVGGSVALAGDLLLDPLREALHVDVLPAERVPVVQSKLVGDAALTGAVLLALRSVAEPPTRLAGVSAGSDQ